ncbi:MAG: hypothetical protein K0R51_411 [Cytophagaceae bacterium]|jgi:hypothetical protein|nr:hypothetical protein [Cytophagaceae bacterium]
MKINSFLVALLLALTVISCKENSEKKTEKSTPSSSAALAHLQALEDSCSKAWNMMISSDDQKIKDLERLLQEISYIPGHNEQELERLSTLVKELSKKRYTPETMTSPAIDAYDQATDEALRQVFDLKRNTKGVENYTLTAELETSIREADGMVVNYRVLYDRWVHQYNESLEKIQTTTEVSDEDRQGLKKKLTFEI